MNYHFSQLFYPEYCLLCEETIVSQYFICKACYQQFPFNQTNCLHCASPLKESIDNCGACLHLSPLWHQAIIPFLYQKPINYYISQLKYHQQLLQAKLLADIFYQAARVQIQQSSPQVIIPIPLHPSRVYQRGFNQTLEISKYLQPLVQIPFDYHLIRRKKNTLPQVGLSRAKRLINLRGSFEVIKPHSYQHVALLDDVMTTGATMHEVTKVLLKSGVKTVDIWAIARRGSH